MVMLLLVMVLRFGVTQNCRLGQPACSITVMLELPFANVQQLALDGSCRWGDICAVSTTTHG